MIDEVGFDESFSFVYSRRPGTPAAYLEDTTPQEVKLARLKALQEKIYNHSVKISESMLGTVQRVLVLGPSRRGRGMMMARTDNNRIVNFVGDESLTDQMVNVKITVVNPHTLLGEMVA